MEYRELKDVNQKTKLETSLGWGIFCAVEVLFMVLINRGLSYFLTLSANKGMTQEEFIAAGGFGYRNIQIDMPIGAVLALPIAFLALFLVKKILKSRDKKENKKNLLQNVRSKEENNSIKAQNQAIAEHNRHIAEQLEILQNEKQKIKQKLQEGNASFPMEYLTVSVIDFVEQELQTGRAKNLNQALVHYEAMAVKK